MENYCFVIQPIADEKYRKRYDDIYVPAIESAGLTAYRVDLDASVKVPIAEIEQKIKGATLCFAEISIDNPNVWYEVGYAFALEKDVVMVCEKTRIKFPFDIQHKSIIPYDTRSTSDFTELGEKIAKKTKAYLETRKTAVKILNTPIQETSGLQSYELAILALIIGEQYSDEISVSIYQLKDRVNKAGFNDTAFSIGIRQLKSKGFITTATEEDFHGNEYHTCKLTDIGDNFALNNIHLFDLKQSQPVRVDSEALVLPF